MDFEILLGEIGKSVGHFGPTYANSQLLVSKPTESQKLIVLTGMQILLKFQQKSTWPLWSTDRSGYGISGA